VRKKKWICVLAPEWTSQVEISKKMSKKIQTVLEKKSNFMPLLHISLLFAGT